MSSSQCATISLLDMLATVGPEQGLEYRIVAIDPVESRRQKMDTIYAALDESGKGTGQFSVASIEHGKKIVEEWTGGGGCNAILEVCAANCITILKGADFGIEGCREQQCIDIGLQSRTPIRINKFGRCPSGTSHAFHWT